MLKSAKHTETARKRKPGGGRKADFPGTPKLFHLQTRVTEEFYNRVEAAAGQEGVKLSEMVYRILARYFQVESQIL